MSKGKYERRTMADLSLSNADIPELDVQTANRILNNVFAACSMEPSSIPVETLEAWGNYRKPKFQMARNISYLFLMALMLLPLLFVRPIVIVERTDVEAAKNAVYCIRVKSLMPMQTVSATLNGIPVDLEKSDSKDYAAEVQENGIFTVKAVSLNGQVTLKTYEISYLDTEKPVLADYDTKDGLLYLVVHDRFSGIDYDNITGLAPVSYDEKAETIIFEMPKETVNLTIPDKAGNALTLLLSPIEE